MRLHLVNNHTPAAYSDGWRDGCKYGERTARFRGRAEGIFAGLVLACAVAALTLIFGGSP